MKASIKAAGRPEVVGDFGYGSYNNITGTGVVNVPVSEGLALRAAVNHEQRDSFYTVIEGTPTTGGTPGEVEIELVIDGEIRATTSTGNGPVDATLKAIGT